MRDDVDCRASGIDRYSSVRLEATCCSYIGRAAFGGGRSDLLKHSLR